MRRGLGLSRRPGPAHRPHLTETNLGPFGLLMALGFFVVDKFARAYGELVDT